MMSYRYDESKILRNVSYLTVTYRLLKKRYDHLQSARHFYYQKIKESHLYNSFAVTQIY